MSLFATRLKIAMQYRNCSGRKLCDMIGAHKSTISNYLHSVCEPKQDKLIAIANALKVNPEWLAGEDVSMLSSPFYDNIIAIIKNLDENDLQKALQVLKVMFGDKSGN
jgi:transcriptional regulator with XRE-family HTH domain